MRAKKIFSVDAGRIIKLHASTSQCGKALYTSRKRALMAAAHSRLSTGELIHAYKCDSGCHGFHIGHTSIVLDPARPDFGQPWDGK